MSLFCKVVACVLSSVTRACDCHDGLLSKRINSEVTSIRIIFNSKFLSLLVNSAISWLLVFYFLQLGVLYLDRCG
jgi:hypothetical protein